MKIEINGAVIELNAVQTEKVQAYILQEVLKLSKDPAQTFKKWGWSKEEEEILRSLDFNQFRTRTIAFKSLEARLGRAWGSISAKFYDLAQKKHRVSPLLGQRPWTEAEDQAIIKAEFHPELPKESTFAAIAEVLRRTPGAVTTRYYVLKNLGKLTTSPTLS